jgi:superoxide dismutase
LSFSLGAQSGYAAGGWRTRLFGNNAWEHAYYLKYQNRRADYPKAWRSVADLGKICERYRAAKAGTLTIEIEGCLKSVKFCFIPR